MRINIPPVTRVLLLSTIILSTTYLSATLLYSRSTLDPYLTLIPTQTLWHPWTILTSTFIEQNVLNFVINTAAIFLGGRYLERAWGSRDFAMVVLIATIIPNLLVIPTYLTWGLLTGSSDRAGTPIAGATIVQAAFLVAFKQLVPEHTVSLYKGLVRVRVKHFPAIFLLLNTIGGLALGTDTALLLAWYGLITTWVYLRFVKHQPELSGADTTRLRGDASETFAFATFFPDKMQPPIVAVCDKIYDAMCRLRIIKPFSVEAVASSHHRISLGSEGRLPVSVKESRIATKRDEAERRRALALKALDERLSKVASADTGVGARQDIEEAQSSSQVVNE